MNIQLALAAIEDFDVYTVAQRIVLKTIVATSVNGVADISASYLQAKAGISRPTVYIILSRLEKDGYITRVRQQSTRQNSYKVNEERVQYIIQLYNNKKSI